MLLYPLFLALLLVVGLASAKPPTHRPPFIKRYSKYYRKTATSRGYDYNFLAIKPDAQKQKPILVFLHGFPSHSHDWHNQIEYFHSEGYGLVVPDLLGFGGTDKPVDPREYRLKLVAQDIIDVVDSLSWANTAPLVSISHDWGSGINSRVMFYHSERFQAYAYLSVGGHPLQTEPVDFDVLLPYLKSVYGYEIFAYQEFFTKTPDAAQLIENNIETFIDLLVPAKPESWKETLGVRYATEAILRNGTRSRRASWLTVEDTNVTRSSLLTGGLTAPLNVYKSHVDGVDIADDATLVGKTVNVPVLFVGASRDMVAVESMQAEVIRSFAPHVEEVSLATGHWIFWEQPKALNLALEKFIEKSVGNPSV